MTRLVYFVPMAALLSACVSPPARTAEPVAVRGEVTGRPLDDVALRALLVDSYVSPHRGGDDGPGEFFLANGVYRRDGGHGAIVFEGRFEISGGTVCVEGDGAMRLCRRVLANGDGSWTFVNIADGTSAVMTIQVRSPFLDDTALRALLSNVSVTPGADGGLDDGPSETFRVNGIYQRLAGRGSAPGEPFEIRNNAVCVPNGGPTPRCRRVHANRDGTYTFIDTADGTATVMTVTPLR